MVINTAFMVVIKGTVDVISIKKWHVRFTMVVPWKPLVFNNEEAVVVFQKCVYYNNFFPLFLKEKCACNFKSEHTIENN